MKEAVAAFIKKHKLLKKHAVVLVAVSGGPDSAALLHYFKTLRADWGLQLIALTVDHQLRGTVSAEDADYVERLCAEWQIPCVRTAVDVRKLKKETKAGTQEAARTLRYDFFESQMKAYQADYLALGHHGDDQAETMLMRFVRSADPEAVTGIPVKRPFAGGEIIRPLLGVSRQDIETYCKANGIQARIDASNEDEHYTRNYYRKRVIPLLKAKNPNLHATMERLSESFREDEAYLRSEAEKMVKRIADFDSDRTRVNFDIGAFKSFPIALQRRAYHLILNYLYFEAPVQLTYAHESQFFALLDSARSNMSLDFPQGLKLVKTYGEAAFSFIDAEAKPYQYVLEIPGELRLPGGVSIRASLKHSPPVETPGMLVLPEQAVELPLTVRTRRNGDRMSWDGLAGTKKLKDLFIDEKIPKSRRDIWPVVTEAGGEIIWVAGLKKNRRQTDGTGRYICLEFAES